MSKAGKKIVGALEEAADIARKAAAVAVIIQRGREEGLTASATAYDILDELGFCKVSRPPSPRGRG